MHLLPELEEYQKEFDESFQNFQFLESHIYIIALLGLVIFYGLEQLAKKSKRKGEKSGIYKASFNVFWVHIGSFALYNAIIGYLILRGEYQSEWGMLLYFVAMGIHFVTNDKGLRATHKEDYDRYGRWLLAVSITIGWLIAAFTEVNIFILSMLSAFLAGGRHTERYERRTAGGKGKQFSVLSLRYAGVYNITVAPVEWMEYKKGVHRTCCPVNTFLRQIKLKLPVYMLQHI